MNTINTEEQEQIKSCHTRRRRTITGNTVRRVGLLSTSYGRFLGIERLPSFSPSETLVGMRQMYGKRALLVKCGTRIYDASERPDIYLESLKNK